MTDVTQQEAFELFIRKLEATEVPYMVYGSVAAMVYCEPRLTNDLDVVVALGPAKITVFHQTMTDAGFYCPPVEVILEEFQRRGQFNLLHIEADTKIDCIYLGRSEHDVEEFRRRERVAFTESVEATVAKPEDVIIKKLSYFKMGGSQKHLSDIRSMLTVSSEEIDRDYIQRWARELNLESEWQKAQQL